MMILTEFVPPFFVHSPGRERGVEAAAEAVRLTRQHRGTLLHVIAAEPS